ncbi:MAG TPA: SDR family oxidoreductase [Bacteroidota bacterium]|nr:SDR family oxidoreductase [Bacteroidota bacterium]
MKTQRSLTVPNAPVVWVTGASRGIGRETAKQFASIGCVVCLTARSSHDLATLANEIRSLGGAALAFPADISHLPGVNRVVQKIENAAGPIDVLICNAGVTSFKTFQKTSLGEFERIVRTNLLGSVACLKAVVPGMIKRKRGSIFNVVSHAALRTFEGASAYTATKAGMLGVGRVLREELRKYNIKVINVLPGPTATDMWSKGDQKKYRKRMMSPKSVAETILSIYRLPDDVVSDEILLRPMSGNIS